MASHLHLKCSLLCVSAAGIARRQHHTPIWALSSSHSLYMTVLSTRSNLISLTINYAQFKLIREINSYWVGHRYSVQGGNRKTYTNETLKVYGGMESQVWGFQPSFERMKSTGMVQKRVVHKVNFCFSDCKMSAVRSWIKGKLWQELSSISDHAIYIFGRDFHKTLWSEHFYWQFLVPYATATVSNRMWVCTCI